MEDEPDEKKHVLENDYKEFEEQDEGNMDHLAGEDKQFIVNKGMFNNPLLALKKIGTFIYCDIVINLED